MDLKWTRSCTSAAPMAEEPQEKEALVGMPLTSICSCILFGFHEGKCTTLQRHSLNPEQGTRQPEDWLGCICYEQKLKLAAAVKAEGSRSWSSAGLMEFHFRKRGKEGRWILGMGQSVEYQISLQSSADGQLQNRKGKALKDTREWNHNANVSLSVTKYIPVSGKQTEWNTMWTHENLPLQRSLISKS